MTTSAVEEVKCVDDIEHEIKAVDVALRLLRADSSSEMTLEGKLAIQKHVRYVEGIRARLRRELFAAMDEAGLMTSNKVNNRRDVSSAHGNGQQPAQPGSGEVSRLAFAAGVTLGELHGNESAELQFILRKLIAAQQRIAAITRVVDSHLVDLDGVANIFRANGMGESADEVTKAIAELQEAIKEPT